MLSQCDNNNRVRVSTNLVNLVRDISIVPGIEEAQSYKRVPVFFPLYVDVVGLVYGQVGPVPAISMEIKEL